jgi:hypothetical protein
MYKFRVAMSPVQLTDIMTYLKTQGHTEIQWCYVTDQVPPGHPAKTGEHSHFLITYYHDVYTRVKPGVMGEYCTCKQDGMATCAIHF